MSVTNLFVGIFVVLLLALFACLFLWQRFSHENCIINMVHTHTHTLTPCLASLTHTHTINRRHHHHHHSCPSQSDDNVSGASGVISDQTLMRRCVHTPGSLRQQLGWPSALSWLGIWCQAVTVALPQRLRLCCGLPATHRPCLASHTHTHKHTHTHTHWHSGKQSRGHRGRTTR